MGLKYDTELGLAVDGIISNSRHYTRTELENMDSSTVFTIADGLGVLYRTGLATQENLMILPILI